MQRVRRVHSLGVTHVRETAVERDHVAGVLVVCVLLPAIIKLLPLVRCQLVFVDDHRLAALACTQTRHRRVL